MGIQLDTCWSYECLKVFTPRDVITYFEDIVY
jgi:hypothetical protein